MGGGSRGSRAGVGAASWPPVSAFAFLGGPDERPRRLLLVLLLVAPLVVVGAGVCHHGLYGLCAWNCVSNAWKIVDLLPPASFSCCRLFVQRLHHNHTCKHTSTGRIRRGRCLASGSGVWRRSAVALVCKTRHPEARHRPLSTVPTPIHAAKQGLLSTQSGGQGSAPRAGAGGGASARPAQYSFQSLTMTGTPTATTISFTITRTADAAALCKW